MSCFGKDFETCLRGRNISFSPSWSQIPSGVANIVIKMCYSKITNIVNKDTTKGNWCGKHDKKCATIERLNTTDISSSEWNQIYLQSKSSIKSSHGINKPKRNPNPNLNDLVIGFCHQSYTFWRIGLMATCHYF